MFGYLLDGTEAACPTPALTASLFHGDSDFVTNNPHLLSFTSEYNSNVHRTPVTDTGGSLTWSQDLPGVLKAYTLGVDLHAISGLRTLLSSCINGIAVVTFVLEGKVDWPGALVMAVGALAGGYAGAAVARRLPPAVLRSTGVANCGAPAAPQKALSISVTGCGSGLTRWKASPSRPSRWARWSRAAAT